jgi:hypothetical protein
LSADLYKIYVDHLLHRLQHSGKGLKIGYINCCATACADDISINCVKSNEAEILLNMAYEYSLNEHYKLQPQKSVVIQMENKRKKVNNPAEFDMNGTILSNVPIATHLGMKRAKTVKETLEHTVNENIQKARTAYSLLSVGFHGNNGLDPSTSIHILKTYFSHYYGVLTPLNQWWKNL